MHLTVSLFTARNVFPRNQRFSHSSPLGMVSRYAYKNMNIYRGNCCWIFESTAKIVSGICTICQNCSPMAESSSVLVPWKSLFVIFICSLGSLLVRTLLLRDRDWHYQRHGKLLPNWNVGSMLKVVKSINLRLTNSISCPRITENVPLCSSNHPMLDET